jgi:hypothetical protein
MASEIAGVTPMKVRLSELIIARSTSRGPAAQNQSPHTCT